MLTPAHGTLMFSPHIDDARPNDVFLVYLPTTFSRLVYLCADTELAVNHYHSLLYIPNPVLVLLQNSSQITEQPTDLQIKRDRAQWSERSVKNL